MAVLLIRCRLHAGLSAEQFGAWVGGTGGHPGLRAAPLEDGAWVLELEVDGDWRAPLADLVGDLRLLGLEPAVYRSDADVALSGTGAPG